VPAANDHSHCRICRKVCAAGDDTCSADCQAKLDDRARQRRTYMYLIYGTAALLLVLLVANASHL
jgi:predicted nucleic acid-binding Zn ribbon protein